MSKEYRDKFGKTKPKKEVLRKYYQRPGKVNEKGEIQYFTEQHHKLECDVKHIIQKYDKTGLIHHVSKIEAKYGDLTGLEFQNMQNVVAGAMSMFNELPAEIRKEFDNDPQKLIHFMDDSNNRDRAIELGLIDPQWTPETDGLGEHVVEGGNIKKVPEKSEGQ